MGLALVYHGLRLKQNQEILTTAHDHYSHHESIRLAARRTGAVVKKIRLFDDYKSISAEKMTARVREGITAATRVVGITWVLSGSGVRVPVRKIAETIDQANKARSNADRILLVVDGVHGLGVVDDTVAQMGVDFFVAGTHKWMFGPRGTGIIWAKKDNWVLLDPTIPSFTGETKAGQITPGGFHSFEHRWALPAAFDFHRQIGRQRIAQRIESLNDQAKAGLSKMKNVKLHTPVNRQLSAGIVCFDIEGMNPDAVVEKLLAKQVIASETPYEISHARIAPSLLNNEEEIEQTLKCIRELT
jgi:selenocysteine lyase/cysteine desulfurase